MRAIKIVYISDQIRCLGQAMDLDCSAKPRSAQPIVAHCLVGSLRTFLEPSVQSSQLQHLLGGTASDPAARLAQARSIV